MHQLSRKLQNSSIAGLGVMRVEHMHRCISVRFAMCIGTQSTPTHRWAAVSNMGYQELRKSEVCEFIKHPTLPGVYLNTKATV